MSSLKLITNDHTAFREPPGGIAEEEKTEKKTAVGSTKQFQNLILNRLKHSTAFICVYLK